MVIDSKTKEFFKKLYELRPELIDIVIPYGNYINSRTPMIVRTKHGLHKIFSTSLTQANRKDLIPSIKSALNKTEYCISQFKEIFGDLYNYDQVLYKNGNSKVIITCRKHGNFLQAPQSHMNGHGCSKCSLGSMTESEFIEKSKTHHSNKYNYEKVKYNGFKDDVIIICPEHGEFSQLPYNHLSTSGCRKCSNELKTSGGSYNMSRLNANKDRFMKTSAIFYYIRLFNDCESFYKIGITTRDIRLRFKCFPYNVQIIDLISTDLYSAYVEEQKVKKANLLNRYIPKIKFGGYTECISTPIGFRINN